MSKFSVLKQNQDALAPAMELRKSRTSHPRCCWKCQQDKPVQGGSMKTWLGLSKFICKECVEAKRASDEKAQ